MSASGRFLPVVKGRNGPIGVIRKVLSGSVNIQVNQPARVFAQSGLH